MLMKNKRGFSFIEVIVALAIFFIFMTVFFEIKIHFIKMKVRIHEEISYINLQICVQQNFLRKYTYDELEKLDNKTIYYDIKTLDVSAFATLNLNDYSYIKPKDTYIEINITKGLYMEIKNKIYKDNLVQKQFSFIKGQIDEERHIVN